jgi:hypothetical protein
LLLSRRSFKSADAALAAIALHDEGKAEARVRITRRDGTIVEGRVLKARADCVAVSLSDQFGHVEISESEISTIEVRVPHRGREWALAAAGVLLVTALLVGIARLPWAGPTSDFSSIVVLLAIVGSSVAPFVLARTPLGEWLSRWHTIHGTVPKAERR